MPVAPKTNTGYGVRASNSGSQDEPKKWDSNRDYPLSDSEAEALIVQAAHRPSLRRDDCMQFCS